MSMPSGVAKGGQWGQLHIISGYATIVATLPTPALRYSTHLSKDNTAALSNFNCMYVCMYTQRCNVFRPVTYSDIVCCGPERPNDARWGRGCFCRTNHAPLLKRTQPPLGQNTTPWVKSPNIKMPSYDLGFYFPGFVYGHHLW